MKNPKNNSLFNRIVYAINYFGSISNLHGIGHVISLSHVPSFKRLCWLSILLGSCWGTCSILREVLDLYTQGSVSYSVDTNYLSWNTPFPTVTLCEQLDSDRLRSYLAAKKLPPTMLAFFRDVLYYNNQQCKQCTNCKNTTCVDNYMDYVKDYRLKCEDVLNKCWWAGKPYNCCEIFSPLETEYGPCFTFNSRLTGDGFVRYINRTTGLPSLVFTASRLITLRIHAPDDVVSVKVEKIVTTDIMPLVSELNATLKSEAITSDMTIHRLDPLRRGCLLVREKPAFAHHWPFQRYSYSACVLYCRAKIQVDLCNCTHHFMVRLNGYNICNVSGLGCLYKNKESMQSNTNCGCPMACEEINYKAVHVSFHREPSPVSRELIARGSRGVVRLNTLPTLRVRRHAIRDKMALVVDIGGVGGVFFGASLLSVIEIVYLLCIRRSRSS
ncbi:sodium channel protein Nach-like [Cydia strobilella]|uniref:sodium channel protein Nach-like n=1 Tax=Cydia strobilella TaxID=1100964 RepID=UPI0030064FBA